MNLLPLPEGATGSNHSQLDADEPDSNGCYLLVPTEKERGRQKERTCFYVWVKQTEKKRDMQIYINLIMLLVPLCFPIRAHRRQGLERQRRKRGHRERDRERITDSLKEDLMGQYGFK